MKKLAFLSLAIILALILSACAAPSAPGTELPAENVSVSPEATDAQPMPTEAAVEITTGGFEFTDDAGNTGTLPKSPERIVCLSAICIGAFYELGLEPIAADEFSMEQAVDLNYYGDRAKNFTTIGGGYNEPDLEMLASVKPDFIVAEVGVENNILEALKGIAPTFLVKTGTPVQHKIDIMKEFARFTGREKEAQLAEDNFNKKFENYKSNSPNNKTVMIIVGSPETIYVATEKSAYCTLLAGIAKCPWATIEGKTLGNNYANYSIEQILEANPDIIINLSTMPTTLVDELAENSVWKELDAVKNNQVFVFNPIPWGSGDTRSMSLFLDQVMPVIYPDVFK